MTFITRMQCILAIAAGARTHAKFLLCYSDAELLEIERLSEQ
jgi:hypothetical protein